MAVQVDDTGKLQTVLEVKDEGSAVVQQFAENADQAFNKAGDAVGDQQAKLDKFMASGKKGADDNAAGFEKLLGVSVKVAAAVGTAAIGVVTYGLHLGDLLDKQAQKLSVTVDWLQKVNTAAATVDAEDKLGTWVRNMSRNLAQAAESGKGVTSMLEGIGLSAAQLRDLGPERAFEAIVAALEKIPDPMERTRISMAVFGRGADDVFRLGGALRATAEDFAAMEKITASAASASNKFWDNIGLLLEHLRSIPKIVTNDVAVPFAEMARIFKVFVRDSGAIEAVGNGLGIVLRGLGAVVVALGTAFGLTGKAIGGFAATIGALLSGDFREALRIGRETVAELGETVKKFAELEKQLLLPSESEKKPGAKKMSFTGAEDEGGFLRTGFTPGPGASGVYSDILPGAEVRTAQQDEEFEQEGVHQERMQKQRADHEQKMFDLSNFFHSARVDFATRYRKIDLDSFSAFFGQMAGLMMTKSRAMFEIGKAASISQTAVDTIAGAQAAYRSFASIPVIGHALGIAAAAAATLLGIARVNAIRSTTFGTQAAAPVFSASPTTGLPASPVAPAEPTATSSSAQPAAPTAERNLTLVGDVFTAELVRDQLIPMINEASRDGVQINVSIAAT